MSKKAQDEKATANSDSGISSFGVWVRDNRIKQSKSVPQLAKSAGISVPALYGIENGKIKVPQPATQDKLAKALNYAHPPPPDERPPVAGLGVLVDFDPHSEKDWPKCPGVYVLYDVSERPIYIGMATNIATQLKYHSDRFRFRAPIVQCASYIQVTDKKLRSQLEQVMIKFLKNNAVINKKETETFYPD